jgi:hypothetical protein
MLRAIKKIVSLIELEELLYTHTHIEVRRIGKRYREV